MHLPVLGSRVVDPVVAEAVAELAAEGTRGRIHVGAGMNKAVRAVGPINALTLAEFLAEWCAVA